VLHKPSKSDRVRGVLIHSTPNFGKTFWLNATFEGQRVYMRPNDAAYPFDFYSGEEIVVYDDWKVDSPPDVEELIHVMNVWLIRAHVYGKTRYRPRFWPKGQVRFIFMFCNTVPDVYTSDPRFTSRFTIVDVRNYQPIPPDFVRGMVCPMRVHPMLDEHVE